MLLEKGMKINYPLLIAHFFFTLLIAACLPANNLPSATPVLSDPTVIPEVIEPGPSGTPTELSPPEEAIMILEPASGSRVTSPLRLSGLADSTFEQTLVVQILWDDGMTVAYEPVMIQSELGQRGPFELELEFDIVGERNAFIQVFEESARDGEITHLSSVGVLLSGSGPAEIRRAEPRPEQITIFEPSTAGRVAGGVANIRGYGWASFEQTLLVEVQDENGRIAGSRPITLESPDLGQPAHFFTQVPYQVSNEGPGRIIIRDISPAFGGDVHRTSVEITLAP
jgi:hypothetical protein